jgi:predicted nucleic acid-binding protein
MTLAEAVADAGPLIHLDEAGRAEALHVFRRITVPTPVADELRAQPRGPGVRLLRQAHLHVTRPSRDEAAASEGLAFRRLGAADRVAVVMAQARECILLTDDLDLRDAAKALGVTAVGTVGLIVRAATTELLSAAEANAGLDRLLTDSSMFVTKTLVERAKAALKD